MDSSATVKASVWSRHRLKINTPPALEEVALSSSSPSPPPSRKANKPSPRGDRLFATSSNTIPLSRFRCALVFFQPRNGSPLLLAFRTREASANTARNPLRNTIYRRVYRFGKNSPNNFPRIGKHVSSEFSNEKSWRRRKRRRGAFLILV